MIGEKVQITNPTGLHARPAALFVKAASKFTSNIWLTKDSKKVNAKSIMGLMSLAASKDALITIEAEGEDAEVAVKELVDLVVTGLGE